MEKAENQQQVSRFSHSPWKARKTPRAFHIPTASTAGPYLCGRNPKTLAANINPGVGQIKMPKWAKYSCQKHPERLDAKTESGVVEAASAREGGCSRSEEATKDGQTTESGC